jgi:hypothetical protein
MRTLMSIRCALLFSLVAFAGACAQRRGSPDPEGGVICTLEARSSFAVTVTDSTSGGPIRSGATVRVTDGSFADTLLAPGAGASAYSGGVYERPGTYTVAVSHPDYRPWQRSGVEVTRDECHVQTQQLTARLQRRAD